MLDRVRDAVAGGRESGDGIGIRDPIRRSAGAGVRVSPRSRAIARFDRSSDLYNHIASAEIAAARPSGCAILQNYV